jgi:hypothetical protein
MRQLTNHKLNGLNDALQIEVLDGPGAGGASHEYLITTSPDAKTGARSIQISFQNGPITEKGVNGISGEALLAIVIDRLQCFQNGEYKCRENAIALTHLEDAMHWLQHRTRQRLARGVEGTSKV